MVKRVADALHIRHSRYPLRFPSSTFTRNVARSFDRPTLAAPLQPESIRSR
jgi:hypothetical protein